MSVTLRTWVIFELKEKLLTNYLMPESIFICFFAGPELFSSEDIELDRSPLQ